MDKLSINYTDFLKIVSALLVVIGHYASGTLAQGSTSPIWWALASQCGYIGVAVFFFLSGFGLSESDSKHHLSWMNFIKKRFWKIYKPVLLVTILWLVIEYCFMNKPFGGNVLYDVLWGFDDCVLWFVKILFGLYASFYLFSELRIREYKNIAWISLIVASIVLMYIAHVTDGYSSIAIPCFALGIVYSKSRHVYLTLSLIAVAICANVTFSFVTKDNHCIHACINYMCVAVILLFYHYLPIACVAKGKLHKFIHYGSVLSFDLYLIHMKVLDMMAYNKCALGGGNFLQTILLCLIVSYLFFRIRTFKFD